MEIYSTLRAFCPEDNMFKVGFFRNYLSHKY